jgi:hypothetical protein
VNLRFIFSLLVLTHTIPLQAQLGKESWHWQFGFHNTIDFSSGVPVVSSGALSVMTGCASISDKNTGALLFYSDGSIVWDRNNNPMPNGTGLIGGNGDATQAALIIQKPGSTTLYYLMTCDDRVSAVNQGVHYSIIDMTLNGGLGDVSLKNQVLTPPPATEKLTAVKHCNGADFWIITHSYNSNAFNAYLMSASGINPVPVVSNVGTIQQGPVDEASGYLRPSPNGRYLAYTIEYSSVFEMADFDNSSGVVSNPFTVIYPGTTGTNGTHLPYGVAFSADNSKVYVSDFKGPIFQYDLSSGIPSVILASQQTINTGLYGLGAIQLGPDGNIYVTVYARRFLSLIQNPASLTCTFVANGVALAASDSCAFGLPNFIDMGTPPPVFTPHPLPLCTFPSYVLDAGAGNTNYHWSNGDTTQTITINTFGNYSVTDMSAAGCRLIDSFYVSLTHPPVIRVLRDTVVCSNTWVPLTLHATYPNTLSYLWNDGYTLPDHTLTAPGNYWVQYSLADFCTATDSFTVAIDSIPTLQLAKDTVSCRTSCTLAAGTSFPCIWNTGATSKQISATKSGNYSVTVTSAAGCRNSDTIHVTLYSPPIFPNIVTPTSGDVNNRIDFSKYDFTTLQVQIYDRWGKLVFESADPSCIWKPDTIDGTYYILACYKDCNEQTESGLIKGFVTVIR